MSNGYDLSIFGTEFGMRSKWEPVIIGDYAEVPLTRGMKCLVSVTDLPLVLPMKWQARVREGGARNYAVSNRFVDGTIKALAMHRWIMQAPLGTLVDHVSGDTLDNRRENLRFCTAGQNTYNSKKQQGTSSRYKGVTFHKQHQMWYASIRKDNKNVPIGLFDTERDAAKAYDFAAKLLFGEFAKTNRMIFKRIL